MGQQVLRAALSFWLLVHRPQEPTFRKTDFSFFFHVTGPGGRSSHGRRRRACRQRGRNKNHLIEAAPFGRLDQM